MVNKKFLIRVIFFCFIVSSFLSFFFFMKMQEENQLLSEFIDKSLKNKKLNSCEDTVLTIANSIYNYTLNWVEPDNLDLYSYLEATSFFNMSSGVSLKYRCFGIKGRKGDGPCGTMTKVFLRAMWHLGIPARKLQLMEFTPGEGGHTMAEFYSNGKWRVVSPSDSGFVWRNLDGMIATVEEIRNDTSIFNQIYHKWRKDWPYGLRETWNMNWGKIPQQIRVIIKFIIGPESYKNFETPQLYEHPRKLLFIIFLSISSILLILIYLLKKHPKL